MVEKIKFNHNGFDNNVLRNHKTYFDHTCLTARPPNNIRFVSNELIRFHFMFECPVSTCSYKTYSAYSFYTDNTLIKLAPKQANVPHRFQFSKSSFKNGS